MLGLLGLRIFEATGADISDLGEEHGHRVLLNSHGTRVDRHAATRRLRRLAETAGVRINRTPSIYAPAHVRRDVQSAARHADPRTTMRYDRARKNLDRHPNYILAVYMASGT
jgi:integrase/recombinase XerD